MLGGESSSASDRKGAIRRPAWNLFTPEMNGNEADETPSGRESIRTLRAHMIHGAKLRRRERKIYKEPPESLLRTVRTSRPLRGQMPRIEATTSEVVLPKLTYASSTSTSQSVTSRDTRAFYRHASQPGGRMTLCCRGRKFVRRENGQTQRICHGRSATPTKPISPSPRYYRHHGRSDGQNRDDGPPVGYSSIISSVLPTPEPRSGPMTPGLISCPPW